MSTVPGKPTGTLCCILCRGIVAYRNGDNKRFVKHMENEHGAYFDLEFVLATCLMDEEEKKAVRSVIISKHFEETTKVVDIDLVDVKKEPDEDELLLIEEPTTRGRKRSHEEETTNYNLDVVIKEEPSDKISKLSKNKIANDNKSKKQPAILPVTSFKGDQNKSICSQCDASFEKEEYLKIHVKIMHSTDASKVRFYCTECDTSFSRKDNLTLHKKKKHADSPDPIMSEEIEKPLPTVYEKPLENLVPKALEKHWTKMIEEAPNPETSSPAKNESLEKELDICVPCNVTFTQRGNLTRHNKKFHPDEVNSLQCNNCEKAFTRQDNLTKHIKNYHPEAVESDKCDQCEYSNPRKDRLKKHKETMHANSVNQLKTVVETTVTEEVVHVQTEDMVEDVKHRNKTATKPYEGAEPENKATTKPSEEFVKFVKPESKITTKTTEDGKPQNKATSRTSSKPKYITNYPCDKCDKVFSERETILEHVKDIHGIIVPGLNKKAEEEKKQREVTKFWQNKAKELNDDPEPTPKEDESENTVDVTTAFVTDPIDVVENPEIVVGNPVTLVEDPLDGDKQIIPKIEQDEGPIARVVITTLEGGDASNYFIRENLNESDFDPLSNDSEEIDDPQPMEEVHEPQVSTLDGSTEDQESTDDPESSDELEVQHELDEDESGIEQIEVEEMETNEEPEKTAEESSSYIQMDISKSKYFKMNSYTICSLDLYTSGVEGDFEECFDLPEGWKFKSFGPDSNPKKLTHFITPDQKVIKSRLGAIEYLRLSGKYSRQELWEYSKYLNVPDRRFDQLF